MSESNYGSLAKMLMYGSLREKAKTARFGNPKLDGLTDTGRILVSESDLKTPNEFISYTNSLRAEFGE